MAFEILRDNVNRRAAAIAAVGGLALGTTGCELYPVSCEGEEQIVVESGDTLWAYAQELNPDSTMHMSPLVEEVRNRNPDIESGRLIPGQIVVVPKSCS